MRRKSVGLAVIRRLADDMRLAVASRRIAGVLGLRLALEKGGPVFGAAVVAVLDHHDFGIAVARLHARHQACTLLSLGAADPLKAATGMLMKNSVHGVKT